MTHYHAKSSPTPRLTGDAEQARMAQRLRITHLQAAAMTEALIFAAGLAIGGVVAWLIAGSRARAASAASAGELQNRLGASDSTVEELRRQITTFQADSAALRSSLQVEREGRVTAETRLEESSKNIAEQRKLLEEAEKKLKDAFSALSVEALRHNSEAFAKQAAEKVRPLAEALKRYEEEIKQIEKSRQASYSGLTEQIKAVAGAHQQLARETTSLTHALRKPEVKGRWGELQLRRTVEAAGMSAQCDYVEQFTVADDEGRLRPDLIIKLPGNRNIVVDSKVSTNAYLDALQTDEPEVRRGHLAQYSRAIREHIKGLSSKAYWSQFESTPDFVVMFVPGESFFSAALEQDQTLIEDAMRSRVILASPTTLIALLRAVAYSWKQQELIENARQIGDTARELFDRVCTFAGHLGKVGENLKKATESYNAAARSWETRLTPLGRRIVELGVSGKRDEFAELEQIEATVRMLPNGAENESGVGPGASPEQ